MTMMINSGLILVSISMIIMSLSSLISKKTFMDREKMSPFECGFDPKSFPRIPFSLHFFLIAVIFLIFDVEITLILPLIMIMKIIKIKTLFMTMLSFMMILLWGLYHEWNQGALKWKLN